MRQLDTHKCDISYPVCICTHVSLVHQHLRSVKAQRRWLRTSPPLLNSASAQVTCGIRRHHSHRRGAK